MMLNVEFCPQPCHAKNPGSTSWIRNTGDKGLTPLVSCVLSPGMTTVTPFSEAWGSGIWISDSFAHEGVACLANPRNLLSHTFLCCWLILAFFAVYLTFPVSWVNLHWLEGGFPVGRSGSESFTSTPTNMWVKTIKATCAHGFSIMKL